ncbi:MAG: hypothetical protein ABIF77_07025 [bacterium]
MTRNTRHTAPVLLGLALLLTATGVTAQVPTFFISEYIDGTGDDFEICSGATDEFDVFSPCPEWEFFSLDTIGDLGFHSAICAGVVPAEPASWGTVQSLYR